MKAAVHKNLRWIEAEAVRSLAHVKLQMLDREKAMKYVKEALVISKELGVRRTVFLTSVDICYALIRIHDITWYNVSFFVLL